MGNNLKGSVRRSTEINTSLSTKTISVQIGKNNYITADHAKLKNLDYANSGHTGFAGILYGTTAYWNSQVTYRPPINMLIVYSDYKQYQDEHGNIITVPGFKISDGKIQL